MEIINAFQRTLHSCNGMGNRDKMVGNSKVCMGEQSQLNLIVANMNWIYFLSLSLWKMWLMNLKKLHTKSGVHSSPSLLLRKPEFFHTFSVILQHKNYP